MRSTALRTPAGEEHPAHGDLTEGLPAGIDYALADQINHRLRRAHQRASAIFMEAVSDAQLTPTQWAALAALSAAGALSQNQLGRLTCMDPATTQGVILRLVDRKLVERRPDPQDRRRTSVRLTRPGQELVAASLPKAREAHARTLEPLNAEEQGLFLDLLARLM